MNWTAPRTYSLRHRNTPKVFPVTTIFRCRCRILELLGPLRRRFAVPEPRNLKEGRQAAAKENILGAASRALRREAASRCVSRKRKQFSRARAAVFMCQFARLGDVKQRGRKREPTPGLKRTGLIDETAYSRDNGGVAPRMWACGAVGSALPWHGRGHRFDPDQVHQ